MTPDKLTIFINQKFPDDAANQLLLDSLSNHNVVLAKSLTTSNLAASTHDPAIDSADVAFGQPDPSSLLTVGRLKWAHLTSAGYDRYDRPDLRAAFASRDAALTNSSSVYDDPCAQHALAMILAHCRQLPSSFENQRGARGWPANAIRANSRLLTGQRVLILSFGAIARRLIDLLAPFNCDVVAVRRRPTGDEPVKTIADVDVEQYLPLADHVVNILPGGESTKGFVNTARLSLMNPLAALYNIGRGTTIDPDALLHALTAKQLAAAYLDVTTPEPLPPDHALWTAPNCHITPHTAGGHHDEFPRLVRHFLDNLQRHVHHRPLRDRVI